MSWCLNVARGCNNEWCIRSCQINNIVQSLSKKKVESISINLAIENFEVYLNILIPHEQASFTGQTRTKTWSFSASAFCKLNHINELINFYHILFRYGCQSQLKTIAPNCCSNWLILPEFFTVLKATCTKGMRGHCLLPVHQRPYLLTVRHGRWGTQSKGRTGIWWKC